MKTIEKIEKHVNEFTLSAAGTLMLALAVLTAAVVRLSLTDVVNGLENIGSIGEVDDLLTSASAALNICLFLSAVLLISGILQAGGSLFVYAYKKEKCPICITGLVSGCMAVYGCVKVFVFGAGVKKVASAGIEGGLAFLESASEEDLLGAASRGMELIEDGAALPDVIKVSLVMIILMGIYAAYTFFVLEREREASFLSALDGIKEKIRRTDRRQKLTVIGIIAAAAVLLGGYKAYDTFFNFEEIDLLEKMSRPVFEGYDGAGSVERYPELGAVDCDMSREGMAEFLGSVTFSIDRTENLSNGDEVTVTALYSEEDAKKLKIKIAAETVSFTVEGLTVRYRDGDEIPQEDADAILRRMDWMAGNMIDDYYQDRDGSFSWERSAALFARDVKDGDAYCYYDEMIGIYQVKNGEDTAYVVVETSGPVNSDTDPDTVGYTVNIPKDHFVYSMEEYLNGSRPYELSQIGTEEETYGNAEEAFIKDWAAAAQIIYPATESPAIWLSDWNVSVEDNCITYVYKTGYTLSDTEIQEKQNYFRDSMGDRMNGFRTLLTRLEDITGVGGIEIRVQIIEGNGASLFSEKIS